MCQALYAYSRAPDRKGVEKIARAAAAEAADAKVIRLRPDLAEAYRGQVTALEGALAGNQAGRAEVAEILRGLIGKIVVTPQERRGEVDRKLHGELAAILTLAQGPEQSGSGFVISMVAGGGLEPPTSGL